MRHSLTAFAITAVLAAFAFGAGPAKAAPLPKIDTVTSNAASPVEAVRYYRRWGYRPYRYRRPYAGYYPPRAYYGYGYRPYYRNYGYWNRPYYGRRYWR